MANQREEQDYYDNKKKIESLISKLEHLDFKGGGVPSGQFYQGYNYAISLLKEEL